jgi:hypothetical protein
MRSVLPRTLPDSPPRKRKRAGPFTFSSSPGGSGLLAPRKRIERTKAEETDEEIVEFAGLPEKQDEVVQVEQEPFEETSTADLEPEPAPKKVNIEFEE